MRATDIDAMIAEGVPFDTIEDRIDSAQASVHVKSVLWLWAWVNTSEDNRRSVVEEMIRDHASTRCDTM